MSDRTAVILRGLRGLLCGALLARAVPAVAQAATVNNTNDSGADSLRAAITNTPSGGTVDFQAGLTGTITLTSGVLSITQSVNIVGPGAGSITVSGNHNTTVFDIAPSLLNQNVTISGLTITNGSATTNGGAIFKLTQARNGLTSLSLAEGAFQGAPSYATCKSHKAGEATAAASSKTLQLLHASAKGKFRTKGRYSAATVRGTKWTIADRCDGTLTRDLVHSVAVTDFVRHKTIVLHAGQSYLAKAPGHE